MDLGGDSDEMKSVGEGGGYHLVGTGVESKKKDNTEIEK